MKLSRKNKIIVVSTFALILLSGIGTFAYLTYAQKSNISASENLGSQELSKARASETMLPQVAEVKVPKAEKPKAAAPTVTDPGKVLVVSISEQKMYAYDNGQLVKTVLVSTGVASHPTPRGTYTIGYKVKSLRMSGPGYDLPNVPNNLNVTGDYFIHGAYWHNNFGHPMSHGCINLSLPDAAWAYDWAPVGTKVTIK